MREGARGRGASPASGRWPSAVPRPASTAGTRTQLGLPLLEVAADHLSPHR